MVGCFVQTCDKPEDLDADILIGSNDKNRLPQIIDEAVKQRIKINDIKSMDNAQFEAIEIDNFENKTRAFIKIQDGCNQFCSYCIIPYARGGQRSMGLDQIIHQARKLVKANHQEIVLTGIHTGRYGSDIGLTLVDVLKALIAIDGLERIRLSSIEINEINDELINLMQNNPKIARHLHIPIQSGCDKILHEMHRPYTVAEFKSRVDAIRNKIPGIAISTDIILGFPGESEADFYETKANINDLNFAFMHIFPYSKRDGTLAARFKNQIDKKTKKERCSEMAELSQINNTKYRKTLVNKDLTVLFEYYQDGFNYGHSSEYMIVKKASSCDLANQMLTVKIVDVDSDALIAQ